MSIQWSLGAAGLLADIVGVSFIAWSFIHTPPRALFEKTQSTWDGNPNAVHSDCEAKVDNLIGFGFLLIGFVVQLYSSLWPEPLPAVIDLSAMGAVLVGAGVCALDCGYFVRQCEVKANLAT